MNLDKKKDDVRFAFHSLNLETTHWYSFVLLK